MMFFQRAVFALAALYMAAGEALHINAFIQNAIDIGLPYARVICTAAVALTFVCSLLILAGLFFRAACGAMVFVTLFTGFFFFAGAVNKVNVVGVMLALSVLAAMITGGEGKISAAYHLAKKRRQNNKRITFR